MQHYNPTINKSMQDTFNLKGQSTNEIEDFIQPTININPKIDIIKSVTATNATSANIYTTPSDKDFYLISLCLSMIKDITSTSTSSSITAVIDGVTVTLIRFPELTLTVQDTTQSLSFPIPIKIDRGTTLIVTNSTNVANISAHACIQGYTVETLKGV